MELKFVFLILAFYSGSFCESADVCNGPFTQFLQCMAKDFDTRLANYQKELNPNSQAKVQQCFTQNGCTPPDFTQAQVGFFVQEPWTTRINTILDLAENMDPKVQKCMTDYFKSKVQDKINDCLRKKGSADVKNFQMPPIPGGNNVNIPKMKDVLLDRMMVQYQLDQCAGLGGNTPVIIACVRAVRLDGDIGAACQTRENCVHDTIKDTMCLDRFGKVHQTACKCFKDEQNRKQTENEIKKSITSGQLERQFKSCHDQNGVPYPKEKVDAAKKAMKDGFWEVLRNQGQIPPGVQGAMNVGRQVIGEMSAQWKGAFCSDCSAAGTLAVPPSNNADLVPVANQPQLPQSPLFNPNSQFQQAPNAFAPNPALVNNAGPGNPNFVVPPPLPSQANAGGPQIAPAAVNQFPAQPQVPMQQTPALQSQPMSFQDFQRQLAQTFGPAAVG